MATYKVTHVYLVDAGNPIDALLISRELSTPVDEVTAMLWNDAED